MIDWDEIKYRFIIIDEGRFFLSFEESSDPRLSHIGDFFVSIKDVLDFIERRSHLDSFFLVTCGNYDNFLFHWLKLFYYLWNWEGSLRIILS